MVERVCEEDEYEDCRILPKIIRITDLSSLGQLCAMVSGEPLIFHEVDRAAITDIAAIFLYPTSGVEHVDIDIV